MVTADQELASPASPGNHPALATTSLYVNDPAANAQFKYPNNYISTRRYNILTFIPLNLFEQFRKISNFYFLANAIVALIPGISSISPYTAMLPLAFVVGVAMIKDGYEDYMRYKSDEAANAAPCWVLRSGSYVQVPSKNVLVGDVVRVDMGDSINADLLLLASTAPEGAVYIETSNLDGETNVKNRKALEATLDFLDPVVIERAKVSIHCDQPSPALLSWHGVLTLDGHEYAVGLDQFLYRSATLRNTQNAYGVVVYAGAHTKMYLNLQQKASKVSALTRKLNYLIIGALLIQQILLIIMSGYAVSFNKTHGNHWYIAPFLADQGSGARLFFLRYLSYFLLISYLIPISLFVTLELCKVAQATLMAWDQYMMEYMDGKWQTCRVNNSDVSEELAQVSYIFTDKTGTLTENCMKFYQGDILGTRIGNDSAYESHPPDGAEARNFFRLLSLCNTIQPFQNEKDPSGLQYEGQSPDEIALVHTAAGYGYRLIERTSKALVIEDHGQRLKYTILATLEFTADRKMMSIIVREPDTGRIMLLTKGADTNVMAQLSTTDNTNTSRMNSTNRTLIDMASQGLRTLVLAQREMSESEFKEWYAQFEEAGKALTNRSQEVDTVCLRAERDLTLVGITAIEDKLQDQVPETLQFFLDAGVVIWMLTGDKRETALTIAATSKLVDPQNDFVQHIDVSNIDKSQRASALQNQLGIAKRAVDRAAQRVTIVVDGISLTCIQELCSELFVDVAQGVNSAVCCRLTPLQKANIVAMFQKTTGKVALAIGDGANDVSMIQEGRVGVGIVGLEGAQASRAADYAIPRFKHLRRLCAVHGRYSLYRNTMCIFVSFYKNILLSLLQFYFAFYNGASTKSLIDGWSLSFFNFAFLSWPPLLIGFFEKDVNESCVVSDPMLYRPLSRGKYFNWRYGSIWFGEAVLQSIFVFFIISTFTEVYNDVAIVGITHMTIVVTLSLLKIFLHLRYNTIIQVVGIVGSFGIYILFLVVYSAIPNLFGQSAFYFVGYRIHAHVAYWINVMTLAGGFLLMFDIPALGLIRSWFTPYRKSSVREKRITTSQLAKDLDPKMQSYANHPHS